MQKAIHYPCLFTLLFSGQLIPTPSPWRLLKRQLSFFFPKMPTNLTKCDILGQIMVLFHLATLWPVINTAQRRHSSLQLRPVKTTKKPPIGRITSSSSGNIYPRSKEKTKDRPVTYAFSSDINSESHGRVKIPAKTKWHGLCAIETNSVYFQEGILIPDVVWNRTLENTW